MLFVTGIPMWLISTFITQRLGAAIIILYIPLCIMSFYIKQTDSLSWRGTVMLLCLLGAAVFVSVSDR